MSLSVLLVGLKGLIGVGLACVAMMVYWLSCVSYWPRLDSSTIPMETREQTERNWPGLCPTYISGQREDLVDSFNVKKILQKISMPTKSKIVRPSLFKMPYPTCKRETTIDPNRSEGWVHTSELFWLAWIS